MRRSRFVFVRRFSLDVEDTINGDLAGQHKVANARMTASDSQGQRHDPQQRSAPRDSYGCDSTH